MDPKEKAQKKIDDAVNAITAIFALADAEKRALTDDERTKVADFEKAAEEGKADLEKIAADDAARQRLASLKKEANKPQPRKVPPEQPGAHIGRIHDNAQDDPNKGFKSPREFITCVIDAGRGVNVDERLRYLTVGSDEARGNSDPAGGFLVPEGFSPSMLQIMPESDPMGSLVTRLPMSNSTVKIPARVDTTHTSSVTGGLTVTRRPETVAGTASQMTLSQVVLEAHSLFGLSYVTEELLVDSPISFAALLEAGFSDQFTSHLINERLNGTGVGEFTGALNATCTVSQAKETGQAAATVLYENIIKMRSRCWGYGSAIWLANHDTMPQLMLLNQAVGTGGMPVWQPSAREDHPDMLLGRPLIFTEYCQTLGTVGDIVLGNWSQFLEGIYQPLQSAESVHVRFVNHERTFKFWLRNAGAPWWKAALTPKNSSTTLSPFVTLATRS